MKRLIKHLKVWNYWRKSNGNSCWYKLLVLFGAKVPTYYTIMYQIDFYETFMKSYKEERKKIKKFLKNGGMTAKEGAELGKMLHDGIMQGFEEVNADDTKRCDN